MKSTKRFLTLVPSTVLLLGLAVTAALAQTPTVGVNKDLKNNNNQPANNIEILLAGNYTNVNHYDGYPANQFGYFNVTHPGGNTLLTWSIPNNDVQPGQIAHVGFNVPGTSVTILDAYLTRNKKRIGCIEQVSTNTHLWGSPGSQVIYTNSCLGCKSIPRYVGELTVKWFAEEVPLAELNARLERKPIRTDVIQRGPILLAPKRSAAVDVPAAPPNARFAVVEHKVSKNAKLSGADVTTDFLEFPVIKTRTGGAGVKTEEIKQ